MIGSWRRTLRNAEGGDSCSPATVGSLPERCARCRAAPNCPITGLSSEALSRFLHLAQVRVYGPGATILRQEDDPSGVFIIRRGRAKLFCLTRIGKTLTMGIGGPGSMLGLTAVLLDTTYEATAVALHETNVDYICRKDFLQFLDETPALAVDLLPIVGREASNALTELVDTAGRLPLSERLMHRFKTLSETWSHRTADGVKLDLPLTVQDIAESLGCSRQWASKVLKDLEDQGSIRRRGRSITLTNIPQNER